MAFAPNKKYKIKCKIQPMRTANFFKHVLGCEIITKSISALITTNRFNHLSRNRGLFHKAGFLEAQGLLAWKRGNSEETKGKLKPRNSESVAMATHSVKLSRLIAGLIQQTHPECVSVSILRAPFKVGCCFLLLLQLFFPL